MEAPIKELRGLEAAISDKCESNTGKPQAIQGSLEGLLSVLEVYKEKFESCESVFETAQALNKTMDARRKDVDDRQKEIYSSWVKLGKALDKKFTSSLPSYEPLFTSEKAVSTLERAICMHYLRTGQFDIAEVLIEEAHVDLPKEIQSQFVNLYQILGALRKGQIEPALEWVSRNRVFLQARSSTLEFYLHRSQFIHLLTSSPITAALTYARMHFAPFYTTHASDIQRLMASMVFLPLARLRRSPYADLTSENVHTDLEPLFAQEWCASLGMSKQVPLRVISDLGGGGALARIEKGRKVMKERKGGWSQADELPMEIPLPPENRYHSIFACPVSKEHATEENPPVMMSCGHVITKDSLQKLSKPAGRVKCPYCPVESQVNMVLRVHF